ncbi:hypothetical protein TTRE_0000970801 [Trichuris trichiura]|uniref:Uncharacterized protein n=1 Tax=Trichuris trichiura TaxID=36087 RepID=A0A077ZR05_TRITR|nr:hypothetical protein TTRE_0000970801 [Trichuris trichiura]
MTPEGELKSLAGSRGCMVKSSHRFKGRFSSSSLTLSQKGVEVKIVLTAEPLVQSTKEALRKEHSGNSNVRLARRLLAQHTTRCTSVGKRPAELLCNRRLSTLLDKLRSKQRHQGDVPSEHKKGRTFQSKKRIPAVVINRLGERLYTVRTSQGELRKRQVDQLRHRETNDVVLLTSDVPYAFYHCII